MYFCILFLKESMVVYSCIYLGYALSRSVFVGKYQITKTLEHLLKGQLVQVAFVL